jgi:hypothetical protein
MEELFYGNGEVWRKVMRFREEVRGKLSGEDRVGVYEPRTCDVGEKAASGDERDGCSLSKSVHR